MVRVREEEMAYRVFRTLETLRGVYYVQRAIDHDGCDVRAFVVGGRLIGASGDGRPISPAAGGRGPRRSDPSSRSWRWPRPARWARRTRASISSPRATARCT